MRRSDEERPLTGYEKIARYRAKRRALGLGKSPAEKASRKRQQKTPAGRRIEHARRRARKDERPFVGIDGEGCGQDGKGRQNYMLLRAGEHELFTGKPLATVECLDFLCCLPARPILVGFSFGYDVTQILRDLPAERLERIFANKPAERGMSRYTYFGNFGIEYLPKNYLRVCRTKKRFVINAETGERRLITDTVPGSARTVYETFGFFQSSFLKALHAWDVGDVTVREEIERQKNRRADFAEIGDAERDYCRIECELLAEMMQRFRAVCHEAGLRPRTWNGAGKLATALHDQHGTIKASRLAECVPQGVREAARLAYYGGRFEITRTGLLQQTVHEYDIQSAYPAAMRQLPCLEHGAWLQAPAQSLRKAPPDALYVADVQFWHPVATPLCGLPVRSKQGRLSWPRQGNGTYWSVEIKAAEKLGCRVEHRAGWLYQKRCDCKPFDWVETLYEYRKSLGKSARGLPIKLAINSLYGKLAQRIGAPKYANMVWAGLITATTRAALMDAAAHDPDAVAMLATDAVLSIRPLPVACGPALGQWEAATHARLFIVQPGLYWGDRKARTRGVSPKFFEGHTERFEREWLAYARAGGGVPPVVTLPVRLFTGLKIALARGKPDTAGRWVDMQRNFNFDWHAKRGRHFWETPDCVLTAPLEGGPDLHSMPHKSDEGLLDLLDLDRATLEDQPDALDMSPPWKE